MSKINADGRAAPGGIMSRLARDVRANTLAIAAGALVPLAGMVGGGIDISRLYIVKTRLQHGCDAGALAGRKAMGGGTWAQSNGKPNATAVQFFDANFQNGSYGSTGLTKSFTESAGKVTGTATVTVPMTLMKVLGKQTQSLSVTCDAEERLPNTDVMFVLDTTGSMGNKAVSTDPKTKIESLKDSVKCFYEIVARIDTDAVCSTGTPSGGTGNQVQVRFGFVPYSTNVNVGKLLPTAYLADNWSYQSRQVRTKAQTTYTFPNQGTPTASPTTSTANTVNGPWVADSTSIKTKKQSCPAPTATTASVVNGAEGSPYNVSTSANGSVQTTTYNTNQSYYYDEYQLGSSSNTQCNYDKRRVTYDLVRTYTRTDNGVATTVQVFDYWHYALVSQNISGLKNGASWNNALTLNIGDVSGQQPTAKTMAWDGCIEERKTVSQASYSPIPATAKDLNIDLVPTSSDPESLWGAAIPDMIYTRQVTQSGGSYSGSLSFPDFDSTTNLTRYLNYYCPTESRKLQSWPTASSFDSYVDSLTPSGNTYHDIGLLWGARLISPTGIFASENALTPQGGDIQRHLIFMTDGDTSTGNLDYAAYGLPYFDRRETNTGNAPTTTELNDQVNARFIALCTAVKNKNITLWVISFGDGSDATTEGRLQSCASSGKFFTARDAATLQTTFASIANEISQLRLTR